MDKKTIISKWISLVFFLILIMGIQLFKSHAIIVYRYYTTGIYPLIKSIQGIIASAMLFSYGEIIVAIALILGIILLVFKIQRLMKLYRAEMLQEFKNTLLVDGLTGLNLICFMVVIFQLFWGLNYYQPTLFSQLELNRQTVDVERLVETIEPIIKELDALRIHLDKSDKNVVQSELSSQELLNQAYIDFENGSKVLYFISKPVSPPKPIASSIIFSYNGISGIYNPFTGEANVNTLNSQFMIPVIALHELAHQQGIAREDEANFIAYLIAMNSSSDFSRYSGNLLVLIHGLNNLKKIDPYRFQELYGTLSEGIKNDLESHRQLWKRYDGPLEETHMKVNDAYLKANGQRSGTMSYSEMIELYVAWTSKNK